MKYALFLDIDGVLHPTGAVALLDNGVISKVNAFRWIGILRDCIQEFNGLQIVIHSDWRHYPLWFEFHDFLANIYPYLASITTGVTPLYVQDRYQSILEYVKQNQIDQYIILDDDSGAFPNELDALILCDPLLGISDSETEAKLYRGLLAMKMNKSR